MSSFGKERPSQLDRRQNPTNSDHDEKCQLLILRKERESRIKIYTTVIVLARAAQLLFSFVVQIVRNNTRFAYAHCTRIGKTSFVGFTLHTKSVLASVKLSQPKSAYAFRHI